MLPPGPWIDAPRVCGRITIPVYYDFASSLCHVAQRVMTRMQPFLDEHRIDLFWVPIDLAALLNWRRGHAVSDVRRDHVRCIADQLEVPLSIPTHWLESRSLAALALHQQGEDLRKGTLREATLREIAFTRTFDLAEPVQTSDEVLELAAELELEGALEDNTLEDGLEALEAWTRHASAQMVTGVPTFMLDQWPVGGIQEDRTMEDLFRRWVIKKRAQSPPRP